MSIWQYCAGPAGSCNSGGPDCWIGNLPLSACTNVNPAWLGAGSDSPPFDPAPSKTNFSDGAWDVMDAPYDLLITSPYDEDFDNGQASIGKNVTWARKHFFLPADWSGQHVEVGPAVAAVARVG